MNSHCSAPIEAQPTEDSRTQCAISMSGMTDTPAPMYALLVKGEDVELP